MAEGDSTDDFLTTLKTLPKVLPVATKSAEGTQDSWCGSDLPHDEGDGMYLALFVSSLSPVSASDDELVVNTGPDLSSPPKNSLSSPSSLGNSVKGKNPLKRKASEASIIQNGDPDRPPAAGPASNTRSMRTQTEASFIAAGGQPTPSIVPKKKARKGKDPVPTIPTLLTHFASATPASSAGPSSSPWGASPFSASIDRHSKSVTDLREYLDKELHSLHKNIESLPPPAPAPSPTHELAEIHADISSLQTRISELLNIATGRFREHVEVINGLNASLSSLLDLPNALHCVEQCLDSMEKENKSAVQALPSRDTFCTLESRVAELERAFLSAMPPLPAQTASHPLPGASWLPPLAQPPTAPQPVPAPMPNAHCQILVNNAQSPGNPFDAIAQMMGCMQNLTMTAVANVHHPVHSPGSLFIAFHQESDARRFMTAARSLPDHFHQHQFLWADNPAAASVVNSVPPPAPTPSSTGLFVDDRHGYVN